jgi:hypothetical protein
MNVAMWPVRATRDRSLRFGHRLALRASHSQRGEIARDGLALCRRRRNSGSHGDGSFTRISGHRRGKPGLPRWAKALNRYAITRCAGACGKRSNQLRDRR